jgi:hypothetical protein
MNLSLKEENLPSLVGRESDQLRWPPPAPRRTQIRKWQSSAVKIVARHGNVENMNAPAASITFRNANFTRHAK